MENDTSYQGAVQEKREDTHFAAPQFRPPTKQRPEQQNITKSDGGTSATNFVPQYNPPAWSGRNSSIIYNLEILKTGQMMGNIDLSTEDWFLIGNFIVIYH
jgi:hypothetical protein